MSRRSPRALVLPLIASSCIFSFIHELSSGVLSPRFQALYSYVPQNEDELELKEGDLVSVMEKCDDGWFVGMCRKPRARCRRGAVPPAASHSSIQGFGRVTAGGCTRATCALTPLREGRVTSSVSQPSR